MGSPSDSELPRARANVEPILARATLISTAAATYSPPRNALARGGRRVGCRILVVEVTSGVATGSLTQLADAGHILTDVGGLGLALFAIRFAERPAKPPEDLPLLSR